MAKTQIYNKEDTKSFNKTLWMLNDGKALNYGLEIGASFLADHLHVSTGILKNTIKQNHEGVYAYPNTVAKQHIALNYLSIPLNVAYTFITNRKVKPYVQIGYQFNKLLSYKNHYEATIANGVGVQIPFFNSLYENENLTQVFYSNSGSISMADTGKIENWLYKKSASSKTVAKPLIIYFLHFIMNRGC